MLDRARFKFLQDIELTRTDIVVQYKVKYYNQVFEIAHFLYIVKAWYVLANCCSFELTWKVKKRFDYPLMEM